MSESKSSICLSMIVRDERHVIQRCLTSVLPIIDAWAIVDTGSTDGTQESVREIMNGVPGQLIERPWRDFSTNRNEALRMASPMAAYTLTIDADEHLELSDDFVLPPFDKDAYFIAVRLGGISYQRLQLFRSSLPWRYEGVVHEILCCDEPYSVGLLAGAMNIPFSDGARSLDPNKYKKDALALEIHLLSNRNDSRATFYLAQSYRDFGDVELAIRYYKKRAAMGGWNEEVWYCLYQVALLKSSLDKDDFRSDLFLRAYEFLPSRAEPLFHLARFYRNSGSFNTAYLFSSKAMQIAYPSSGLFVEHEIYNYLLQLEHAIASHWTGRFDEAIATNRAILARDDLPRNIAECVMRNLEFSTAQIAATNNDAAVNIISIKPGCEIY